MRYVTNEVTLVKTWWVEKKIIADRHYRRHCRYCFPFNFFFAKNAKKSFILFRNDVVLKFKIGFKTNRSTFEYIYI